MERKTRRFQHFILARVFELKKKFEIYFVKNISASLRTIQIYKEVF
jgi:hypothetical protein